MSVESGTFNLLSIVITIITGVIVAVLYVTTRFGKSETKGALGQQQLMSVLQSVEQDRIDFREQYREIKAEIRELSNTVSELKTTITVETHISTETKVLLNEMQKRIFELERKIFDLDRRVNGSHGAVR